MNVRQTVQVGSFKRLLAALLLLLAWWLVGCHEVVEEAAPAPRRLDHPAAARVVWEAFGTPGAPLPVEWRTGAELDCGRAWSTSDRGCIDGRYYTGSGYVIVARWEGATLAETALAHELGHAAQWLEEGVADPDHRGPWFAPGGPVARAEAALTRLGW